MRACELVCLGNMDVSVDVCQGSFPWTSGERRLGPQQTWRRPDRRAETCCWVCFTRDRPAPSLGPWEDPAFWCV